MYTPEERAELMAKIDPEAAEQLFHKDSAVSKMSAAEIQSLYEERLLTLEEKELLLDKCRNLDPDANNDIAYTPPLRDNSEKKARQAAKRERAEAIENGDEWITLRKRNKNKSRAQKQSRKKNRK